MSPARRGAIAAVLLATSALAGDAGVACGHEAQSAPRAGGQEQEADSARVGLRIEVRSSGGGIPIGTDVQLRTPGSDAIPWRRADPASGSFEAWIRPEMEYRASIRAVGHISRTVRIVAPSSGFAVRRIELAPDPILMPDLQAVVRREEVGPGSRASTVRFADTPVSWSSVGEWLGTQAGVSMRGSSAGREQTVSVRGGRPEAVLVLLDGQPLNDPISGTADLSGVSPATLESATLVRGAGSVRYGSGALAGVLLLRSRDAGDGSASAAVRVSSFGGVGGEAQASVGAGGRQGALSVSWDRVQNDFEYENQALPGSPVEQRANADGSRFSAAATGDWNRFRIRARYDGVERGSPGPMGTAVFDRARWANRRASLAGGWRSSAADVSVRGGWLGTTWTPGVEAAAGARDAFDAGFSGEARTGGALDLRLAGRLAREVVRGDGFDGDVGRTVAGIAVSRPSRLGEASVAPALALDGADGHWALSPEIGMAVRASRSIRIRARLGQAFRFPTIGDLYFAPAVFVRSNPELEPERVRLDSELGATGSWRSGGLEIEADAAGWYRVTEDPIVWLASAASVWSPRNLDRLESSGIELSASVSSAAHAHAGWRLSGAFTLDRSRLGYGDNRNPLPYRPEASGSLLLEAWSETRGGRATVRWIGERTTSVAATRTLPGFALLDIGVVQAFPAGSVSLELEARLNNVFDRRYELVELYPEPGRSFALTLRVR